MKLSIETLSAIGNWSWLLYLFTLCLLFIIFVRKKFVSSSFLVVLIITTITWCMNEYRDLMIPIMNNEQLVAQYRGLIRYAWYYGFTGFNILIILAIYKVHVTLTLSYSYTAYLMLYSHIIMSFLQITCCLEQQSFMSQEQGITKLQVIYTLSIPTINILCAMLALMFAVIAFYKDMTNKINRGVL